MSAAAVAVSVATIAEAIRVDANDRFHKHNDLIDGLLWIGLGLAPVTVGLGVGALIEIDRARSPRRGRGLAIAAIVVGALGSVLLLLVLWAGSQDYSS